MVIKKQLQNSSVRSALSTLYPGVNFSYNIDADPVHVHDLHATMLHCLGIDHRRLTYRYQGRNHRLTDVHGNVVEEILR